MDWDLRQQRRIELVLRGWTAVKHDPRLRERAARWLAEHPAGWPPVQEIWVEALAGRGELATWLDEGADATRYALELPLHSVLSSHPFAALPRWSTPPSSNAS